MKDLSNTVSLSFYITLNLLNLKPLQLKLTFNSTSLVTVHNIQKIIDKKWRGGIDGNNITRNRKVPGSTPINISSADEP